MSERSARARRQAGEFTKQWQRDVCESWDDPRLAEFTTGAGLVAAVAASRLAISGPDVPVGRASRFAVMTARTPAFVHGQHLPPPLPDLPDRSYSEFTSALNRLRQTPDDLRKLASDDPLGLKLLPARVLTHIFSPQGLRAFKSVVEQGPAPLEQRAESVVAQLADTDVSKTRRKEAGKKSAGAIANDVEAMWQFLRQLDSLRRSGVFDEPALDQWHGVPDKPPIDAEECSQIVEATPLPLVRHVLARAKQRVLRRLRVKEHECPVQVAADAPRSRYKRLMFVARDWTIVALLAVLGCRAGAIAEMKVGDFFPRVRLWDGSIGPAVRIRPQKSRKKATKPIPAVLADIIRLWLVVLERWLGRPLKPSDPMFPSKNGAKKNPPVAMDRRDVTSLCSGAYIKKKRTGTRPRLPRDIDVVAAYDDVPVGQWTLEMFDGWHPHSVRHMVSEVICGPIGRRWLKANGHPEELCDWVSDALLDHKMGKDPHGYKGASTRRGRERLSAMGTAIMAEALFGVAGAAKRPDPDAIAEANQMIAGLEMRRRKIEAELDKIEPLVVAGEAVGKDAVLKRRLGKIETLLADVTERRTDLYEKHSLFEVVNDVTAYKLGLVPYPLVEEAPPPLPIPEEPARARRVRSWLLLAEYAALIGFPPASLRKFINGDYVGRQRELPWDPSLPAPVQRLDGKKLVIFVDLTNQALLNTPERQEQLERLLSRFPDGAVWADPDGIRTQVRAPSRLRLLHGGADGDMPSGVAAA